MQDITEGCWLVDLDYQSEPHLIACGVIETTVGLLLLDPGPTVALDTLRGKLATSGVRIKDVHGLLLTHIHLDHAGASGTLVAENPDVKVYVHEIGARHMIAPARLLSSARRLYGEMMDTLWGEFLPVPEENVVRLRGGEALEIGGRTLQVCYTPGHAVHHVSYFDETSGTAYIGDVAGMRVSGDAWVIPVAPPPDISLEQWRVSLDVVRLWQPERLFLTHFGVSDDVAWHLDTVARNLEVWAERVRESLLRTGDAVEHAAAFGNRALADIAAALPAEAVHPYRFFGRPEGSWYGIARYWNRKNAEKGTGGHR